SCCLHLHPMSASSVLFFSSIFLFFFFNDPATTEIYPLSLHDALPILFAAAGLSRPLPAPCAAQRSPRSRRSFAQYSSRFLISRRSEEHTSELQSLTNLVCRLLLEKKKNNNSNKLDQPSTLM